MDEKDRSVLHLIEAVEAFISETEAALLEVEFGEAASQAVMEAYAVLRAMDLWGPKMRTRAMFIRSDSVVALGMAKKLSSPHSSLNFLAAEIVLRSCCAWRSSRFQKVAHHHLRGKWNQEAGWLSRLRERGDAPRPQGLAEVRLRRAPVWDASRFWLKPPGDRSAGDARFTPQNNIFDHIAVR